MAAQSGRRNNKRRASACRRAVNGKGAQHAPTVAHGVGQTLRALPPMSDWTAAGVLTGASLLNGQLLDL
eukprot:21775-Eustigmatos_ZCMA.PRE.1